MTVTIPARAFTRLARRVTAVVPAETDEEVPVLRHVHAWTDGKHLLMEASDRRRIIRTRQDTTSIDNRSLDAIIPSWALTAACRLIPDPVPVAKTDWEDGEAWISTVDPAKGWMVSLDTDDGQARITVRGDTTATVTCAVRPRSEWPDLDALWARTRVAVGPGPTCYTPHLLAGLLAVEDREMAAMWPSGGDHRPTVVTLGPDTVALITPSLPVSQSGDPGAVPDPRDSWPGLLADDREAGES